MNRQATDLCYSHINTGMARALLAEIADRLDALKDSGVASVIDLGSLPLTRADLTELDERLGRGEVKATIDVIGETEIHETACAGVWWVRHLGTDREVAAEEIVVAEIPEILKSQPEDIGMATINLRNEINNLAADQEGQEATNG